MVEKLSQDRVQKIFLWTIGLVYTSIIPICDFSQRLYREEGDKNME
jgi:hypothetical protein